MECRRIKNQARNSGHSRNVTRLILVLSHARARGLVIQCGDKAASYGSFGRGRIDLCLNYVHNIFAHTS